MRERKKTDRSHVTSKDIAEIKNYALKPPTSSICTEQFLKRTFFFVSLSLSLHIQPFVHIHFIISVLQDPRRGGKKECYRKFFARAKKKYGRLLCDVMICRLVKRVSPFFTCHRPSPHTSPLSVLLYIEHHERERERKKFLQPNFNFFLR